MLLQHLPLRLHFAATARWEEEEDKSFLGNTVCINNLLVRGRGFTHTHRHTHTNKHMVNTHTKTCRNIEIARYHPKCIQAQPPPVGSLCRGNCWNLSLSLSFSLSLLLTNPHLVRRLIIGRLMHRRVLRSILAFRLLHIRLFCLRLFVWKNWQYARPIHKFISRFHLDHRLYMMVCMGVCVCV